MTAKTAPNLSEEDKAWLESDEANPEKLTAQHEAAVAAGDIPPDEADALKDENWLKKTQGYTTDLAE